MDFNPVDEHLHFHFPLLPWNSVWQQLNHRQPKKSVSARCSFLPRLFSLYILSPSACDLPSSSLFLSKANSTSTGQLDKLVSPAALTPESEEEHSLPPQRVSTFRPRPYSMADSNKVRNMITTSSITCGGGKWGGSPLSIIKGIPSKYPENVLSVLHCRSPQNWPLHRPPQPGNCWFRFMCDLNSAFHLFCVAVGTVATLFRMLIWW